MTNFCYRSARRNCELFCIFTFRSFGFVWRKTQSDCGAARMRVVEWPTNQKTTYFVERFNRWERMTNRRRRALIREYSRKPMLRYQSDGRVRRFYFYSKTLPGTFRTNSDSGQTKSIRKTRKAFLPRERDHVLLIAFFTIPPNKNLHLESNVRPLMEEIRRIFNVFDDYVLWSHHCLSRVKRIPQDRTL